MKLEKSNRVKQILLYSTAGLILCVSSLGIIISNSNELEAEILTNEVVEEVKPDVVNTATILSVGDIMSHKPINDSNYSNKKKAYVYDSNYKYVKKYIEKADLAIGNLETTFAGDSIPYSSYPTFNTPDTLSDALKSSGFDILSTINNHSFDKSDLGFFRTLDVLKEKGIDSIGTRENVEDSNYLIKEVNGINIGMVAFSYGEIVNGNKFLNGIKLTDKAKDKSNIFPQTDPSVAFEIIDKELEKIDSTDIQVLIIHWGEEYKREPNNFQKELAKLLCDRGVDIILGSHPHVVQPVEMIKSDKNNNETLVAYSLGNFISNQRREYLETPYTEDGLMIDIEISKNETKKETKVSKVKCIPTWVNKYSSNGKIKYEIMPLTKKEDLLSNPNLSLSKAEASYKNTKEQIKVDDIVKVVKNPFK